jgi:DNA modification methylase
MSNLCQADVMAIPFADGSFQAVVFSPPYWGLRNYSGTARWIGGDEKCDHVRKKARNDAEGGKFGNVIVDYIQYSATCPKCGAIREDKQLGSEKLHDCGGWATGQPCGECFVCHTVAYMREVKRVLRDDGVVWLNVGDSYSNVRSGSPGKTAKVGNTKLGIQITSNKCVPGLKPKDLCLIPERVALALQADGWWVRAPIIWHKPNPMPGSQRTGRRLTSSLCGC